MPFTRTINSNETKNTSKQQGAYERIKDAIIRNELRPDTVLVERQLCEKLGISRTPIREALRRLSAEGFVNFIPDKGMFVSKIRFEDVMEIFELREALEAMAIRLFVLRKDMAIVKELEEALAAQEQAYFAGDIILAREKDSEFHQLYIKGCKNKRLQSIFKTIIDENNRMTFHLKPSKSRSQDSLVQHKKVLQAIEDGNAALAEELVKKHIIDIKEYHISKHYTKSTSMQLNPGGDDYDFSIE